VSIRRVAFVPSAPLLVPAVAGGSANLDMALRSASLAAVAWAVADRPERVTVVATVPVAGDHAPQATWSFHGFGVARVAGAGLPALPWPLGIGAWLLDEVGWGGGRRYLGVSAADPAGTAAPAGERKVAVVVVGDGSACRTDKAPGYLDERAEAFDSQVANLLAAGDALGLGELDADLASQLLCAGWPAWRWLSAALGARVVSEAELVTHVAPYGVGYFVARWALA
jgi:hypothetical protein